VFGLWQREGELDPAELCDATELHAMFGSVKGLPFAVAARVLCAAASADRHLRPDRRVADAARHAAAAPSEGDPPDDAGTIDGFEEWTRTTGIDVVEALVAQVETGGRDVAWLESARERVRTEAENTGDAGAVHALVNRLIAADATGGHGS